MISVLKGKGQREREREEVGGERGKGYFGYLDAVVEEGLSEEMTLALRPTVAGRVFSGREASMYKGPEVGPSSACVAGV